MATEEQKREKNRIRARTWAGKNKERVRTNVQRWAANNQEKRKKIARKAQLKQYGLDEKSFEALATAQDNRCAICGKKPTTTLNVDHCHKSGKVRGLLCLTCNHGLGSFHDNPVICRAAATYLEEQCH